MSAGLVGLEVAADLATVTIDNPPANALGEATLERLTEIARGLGGDDAVRAVVLTAAGTKFFGAGADLTEFGRIVGNREAMEKHVQSTNDCFAAWAGLAQPVVAAVNADAFGGGLELALTCDFIVSDPRARFGLPEVNLGLMPGAGGTQRLPRRIGAVAARKMMLFGAPVGAEEALSLGLVDQVAAPGGALAGAQALAGSLAAKSAEAVRAIKRAIGAGSELGLSDGLAFERELFLEVTASGSARAGVGAFIARRSAPHGASQSG